MSLHLSHIKSLVYGVAGNAAKGLNRICGISWSLIKLATSTSDRLIYVYDEDLNLKDKFASKKVAESDKIYIIEGIAFNEDASKLAVAQSDGAVYVYKLGHEWGCKKSICNKFIHDSSVTSICWPESSSYVAFGLVDGSVKLGQCRTNKAMFQHQAPSCVIAVCCCGLNILSSHVDGTVIRTTACSQANPTLQIRLGGVPRVLCSKGDIALGDSTNSLRFYDSQGTLKHESSYLDRSGSIGQFATGSMNPCGDSLVVGTSCGFLILFHKHSNGWLESRIIRIGNNSWGSVCHIAWKSDGSRLAIGNNRGVVEIYEVWLKKYTWGTAFQFQLVANHQLVCVEDATQRKTAITSSMRGSVSRIVVHNERYVHATTSSSHIICDMKTGLWSEISWPLQDSSPTLYFGAHPAFCLISKGDELFVVEYGCDEILGSLQTESLFPGHISFRVYNSAGCKLTAIAYLRDSATIGVNFLADSTHPKKSAVYTGNSFIIKHEQRVKWLSLNSNCSKLIFRDSKKALFLCDLVHGCKITTLLSQHSCSKAMWVDKPSDVLIAQSNGIINSLVIWYYLDTPEENVVYHVKGVLVDVLHQETDRVVAITDFGGINQEYELNKSLIAFGLCIGQKNYSMAARLLGSGSVSVGLWQQLADLSLANGALGGAEAAYAGIGDIAISRRIQKICKQNVATAEGGANSGIMHAKLAMLKRQYSMAESILIENGLLQDAISMYQLLHRHDDAIRLAERHNHHNAADLKHHYLNWLVETAQEEKAAQIQEVSGNYKQAVELYLKGGMAKKAADVVLSAKPNNDLGCYSSELLEIVCKQLESVGNYETAGDVYCLMGLNSDSLKQYCNAGNYRKAVQLAKKHFPPQVVELEEKWGDFLVEAEQLDVAINHFIEAACPQKAVEAALKGKYWAKAAQLISASLPEDNRKQQYKRVAIGYLNDKDYEGAESFFIKAGEASEAVKMHISNGSVENAIKAANKHMSAEDAADLFASAAASLDDLQTREKLYLACGKHDSAIAMYKDAGKYDSMIKLVAKYRPDLLIQTHKVLAIEMEEKNDTKSAESYYIGAGSWQAAVLMYQERDKWDDARRVARAHGGAAAFLKVVNAEANALSKQYGAQAGVELLLKHELQEMAVDFAVEQDHYDLACDVATTALPSKLPDIYIKRALAHEDKGEYNLAERYFLLGEKPKEAIGMHIQRSDWVSALNIAEKFDKEFIPFVLEKHAEDLVANNELVAAEQLYLDIRKPEHAVAMYVAKGRKEDAIRVCKKHAPDKLKALRDSEAQPQLNECYDVVTEDKIQPVKEEYNSVTHSQRHSEDLDSQLRELLQKKMWEECAEKAAASKSSELFTHYFFSCVTELCKSKQHLKCVELLLRNGCPSPKEMSETYISIGRNLLEDITVITAEPKNTCIQLVREFLIRLITPSGKACHLNLSVLRELTPPASYFSKILLVTHYTSLAIACSSNGLTGIAAKQLTSNTRYCDVIRVDKLFYEAGILCNRAKWTNMAFLFLNRFLDIVDAIDDPDNPEFDNADFVHTDIPVPEKFAMPSSQYYCSERIEEVRDLVLNWSVDQTVEPLMPMQTCVKCGSANYEANLTCNDCGHIYDTCCVTGYPIKNQLDAAYCHQCHSLSNKQDWHEFVSVFGQCAWCQTLISEAR